MTGSVSSARIITCARCGRERRHRGRGMCGGCYMTAWKAGELDRWPSLPPLTKSAEPRHGTTRGWSWHRRTGTPICRPCRRAHSSYSTWRKLRRAEGQTSSVDATPVREHLTRLIEMGMTVRSISLASGVATSTLFKVLHGQPSVRRTTLAVLTVQAPLAEPVHPADETFVRKDGTVRRIQALQALGWRHCDLHSASGVNTGLILSQPGRWVTVRTHAAIARAYDELSMRPGPSARTRSRAQRKGWLTPLHWDEDEIDDPRAWPRFGVEDSVDLDQGDDNVDPVVVWRVLAGQAPATITTAERQAVVEAGTERGLSASQIAELLAVSTRTVVRRRAA